MINSRNSSLTIDMKLTDKQKKQIEEDLAAFTNEYASAPILS